MSLLLASALTIQGVPVECINAAARRYQVPAPIIVSILKVEAGAPGIASRNKNGTDDLGSMQINSRWLPIVSRYGVDRWTLQNNSCVNVMVGTWILRRSMQDNKPYFVSVANYHSHTAKLNQAYAIRVRDKYLHLMQVLHA